MYLDLVAVLMSQEEQPLTRRMVLKCQNSEARFDSSVVFFSLLSNKVVMTDIL
jgi:hypothetical protein